jgi:hypothetical protein
MLAVIAVGGNSLIKDRERGTRGLLSKLCLKQAETA